MPIAFCNITPALLSSPETEARFQSITDKWATAAAVDATELTLQVQPLAFQVGRSYAVIATVVLPALWPSESQQQILLGLSQALCQTLDTGASEVLVMLHPLPSGTIVDDGELVTWEDAARD